MPDSVQAIIAVILILAASVWLGGYVAIAVVARVSARVLEPAQRAALFRTLGRTYLVVGGGALVLMYASGAALITAHGWDATAFAAAVLAVVLVVILMVAARQARHIGRLRRRAFADPDDTAMAAELRSTARSAGMLRGALGVVSLALVALGAVLSV